MLAAGWRSLTMCMVCTLIFDAVAMQLLRAAGFLAASSAACIHCHWSELVGSRAASSITAGDTAAVRMRVFAHDSMFAYGSMRVLWQYCGMTHAWQLACI
jgi:hypothetical protein